MKRFTQFIQYNNIIPIVLGVVFLGATVSLAQVGSQSFGGSSLARTNSTTDATALLSVNFETHQFNPSVDGINESEDAYEVTIAMDDYVVVGGTWQQVRSQTNMSIRKDRVQSTDDLQDRIETETDDLVAHRRNVLIRAQENALPDDDQPAINIASLLGGVDAAAADVATAQNTGEAGRFVSGTHRPEERKFPAPSAIVTVIADILGLGGETDEPEVVVVEEPDAVDTPEVDITATATTTEETTTVEEEVATTTATTTEITAAEETATTTTATTTAEATSVEEEVATTTEEVEIEEDETATTSEEVVVVEETVETDNASSTEVVVEDDTATTTP